MLKSIHSDCTKSAHYNFMNSSICFAGILNHQIVTAIVNLWYLQDSSAWKVLLREKDMHVSH